MQEASFLEVERMSGERLRYVNTLFSSYIFKALTSETKTADGIFFG